MSTRQKIRLERIEEIIAELIAETAKGKILVVEGKKDTQALEALEVRGKILTLKTGGKSFLDISQQIESLGADVILLLDFDRRGKEGTMRLKQELERCKIKVDIRSWRELQALVGREVQCIEGIPSFLLTLKAKSAPI